MTNQSKTNLWWWWIAVLLAITGAIMNNAEGILAVCSAFCCFAIIYNVSKRQKEKFRTIKHLLFKSGIAEPVIVVDHTSTGDGTENWSEVVTYTRPFNRQVAHCADKEDAELIAQLINDALKENPTK